MKALLILITLTATAFGKPYRPSAGVPLFEIQQRSETPLPTSTLKIYPSGAWTYQPINAHGHAGALTTGYLDRDTLREIRQALKAAPWQVTFNRIVCFAYSPKFTNYLVHGKLMFTQRMCGNQSIDDTTRAAIARIDALMAPRLPRPVANRYLMKPRVPVETFSPL